MAETQLPTHTRLGRAALTVFLAKGIDAATTREIAAAAGFSEGAIYRHYPSKEAMAQSLFERQHEALATLIAEAMRGKTSLAERVRAVVRAYCAAADADWDLFSYHLLNQHMFLKKLGPKVKSPVDVTRTTLQEAARAGEIEIDNLEITTASVLGVVMQPAIHKFYGRWHGRLSDHAEEFAQAIFRLLNMRTVTGDKR